jgi:hypothetical protein
MHTEYDVELGRDDPALELPWSSDDGSVRYYDVKVHPELVLQIKETEAFPELRAFLRRMNALGFPLQTAKCDIWYSREIPAEEEIFGAACKLVSYVDLVFTADDARTSFEKHEGLAQGLCQLLQRAPEIAATVGLVIRRCYYHGKDPAECADPDEKQGEGDDGVESITGFCLTAYVSGFDDDQDHARQRWAIALTLLQNALVQVAAL